MRKYVIALFLVMFMSLYCFAASPIEEHKAHQYEAVENNNPEFSGKVENGIRIIEVQASQYKFNPDPIVVKLGEKVRLVLTSSDVAHGLTISEFKVKLTCDIGKTDYVEFIADRKGIFVARCSVYCGPGHTHMQGKFIVK